MSLNLTGAPALEPVSLVEAKAHVRVDGTAEDALLSSLIITSRLQVEAMLGLALIEQAWTWRFDTWPERVVTFPLRPILGVAAVRLQNSDGSLVAVPATDYRLDAQRQPPRLVWVNVDLPKPGSTVLGYAIDFTAGFGAAASDVPAPLRQAILLLVAHWFETREPVVAGTPSTRFPEAVQGLLDPYRIRRL